MAKKTTKIGKAKKIVNKGREEFVFQRPPDPTYLQVLKLKYDSMMPYEITPNFKKVGFIFKYLVRKVIGIHRKVSIDIVPDEAQWQAFCASAKKHGLTGEELLVHVLKYNLKK